MRAIRSFGVLRSFAIASALIGAGFTASAQTPKPDLLTPMASHTDWLFNVGTNGTREKFEWKTVTGASSYEFVISQSSTFANYTASTALCEDTGCKTITKTTTSVDHKEMAGFWFLPKQYYWRVRAKKNSVWSDWSTARSFAPYLYMDIAVKAYGNSNGIAFDSPLSRLKGTPSKPNVTATWLTELDAVGANGYNADGALLLAAHATYKAATNKDLGSAAVPTALRTTMRSNLTRTDGWALRERDFLIDDKGRGGCCSIRVKR